MGDAGDQATLGLKVTNFGPIVEADIELRPLTVFVGPSNTGKSYLAILIYALHIVFAASGDPFRRMVLQVGSIARGRVVRRCLSFPMRICTSCSSGSNGYQKSSDSDTATSVSRDPLPDGIAGLVRAELENTDHVSDSECSTRAMFRSRIRRGSSSVTGVGAAPDLRSMRVRLPETRSGSPYEYEFSLKRTGSGTHDFKAIISPTAVMRVGEAITASAWAFFSALRSTQFLRGIDADEAQGRQRTARRSSPHLLNS